MNPSEFLHARQDLISREALEILAPRYFGKGERAKLHAHLSGVADKLGISNSLRKNTSQLIWFTKELRSLIQRALYLKEHGIQEGDEVFLGDRLVIVHRVNHDWTLTLQMPDGKKRTGWSSLSVRSKKERR